MQYDLVFEGGGAKGLVFTGALQALEGIGYQPGRLLGTSAGAITAMLLAAGYDAESIMPVLVEKLANGRPRMSSFMDVPKSFDDKTLLNSRMGRVLQNINVPLLPESAEQKFDVRFLSALVKVPPFGQLFSFIERGGLYSGDTFLEWLREKLSVVNPEYADMTFAQFYAATQKHVSVVAADTTDTQLLVLNHNTAPDCPITWAVRMSMSIPFLWQEVIWQKEWGSYNGVDISGNSIVDGGVLSNFPIELFLSHDPYVTSIMGMPETPRVIGCLIDEQLSITNDTDSEPSQRPNTPHTSTLQRVLKLINTMTGAHDKMVIDEYTDLVVRLPALGYGTTEFDMSEARMSALIAAGRRTMQAYLDDMLVQEEMGAFDISYSSVKIDQSARKILSR